MGYQVGVYRTSQGNELVVASSGNLAIESGGALTMESGATLTLTGQAITSTGRITGSAGFVHYLETATSSYTAIVAYGVSVIKSTGTAQKTYSLGAPVAGMEKLIICNNVQTATGSSTGAAIVTSSGASAGYGSNTSILFSTGSAQTPQWVRLLGQNSTNWLVAGYSTDVTFSAS